MTSIKVILDHLSLALFSGYSDFKIRDLENVVHGHDVGLKHSHWLLFDGKCVTSCLMAIVMFALYFIIYEIFAIQIKCQNVDIENEGQGKGGEKLELAPFD